MRLTGSSVGFCILAVGSILGLGIGTDRIAFAQSNANPLEFSLPTIKRGRQLYTVHCVTCHGKDGRGDTEMREFLKTPPADLTDEKWVYGGHDAAVYDAIHTGREERDMPSLRDKLTDERTWSVVSYIRYVGGERP